MGRPPGSVNIRTREFREQVDAACEKFGYNLIESLVLGAQGDDVVLNQNGNEDSHAMSCRKLLVDYGYPKLKAQEITTEGVTEIRIVDATKGPPRAEEPDPLS